ncbi:MAG TPA: tripartite tricarboxylate transporter substrate-binding protein [Kiloniellales bacterium]|nr:tripartite tricarboxylate transporter substrate-binding protein [Kiloniellales bacterium]
MRRTLLACVALATALGLPFAAGAQSGKDFFKGKTLTYIVATSAGGGYDTYGRLVSKYMTKHLGLDKAVVRNMPGAGHIIGANFLYAAKPDGLTIGTFNTGLIYAQLLKREGVQFDLTKMSWVGKAASDARVLAMGTNSPYKTFEDVANSDRPMRLAVAGVGSASYTETQLLAEAFDLNFELLPGYSGTEDFMAIMRAEADGSMASKSSYQDFVDNGNGRFVLQIGGSDAGDIPQARDLAKTDKARQLANVIESQATLGRFTAGPPGIPEDRLEALRDAYMAALKDPGLLAEAEKLGIPIDPMRGDEVQVAVAKALDRSPEVVEIIARAVNVEIPTDTVEAALLEVNNDGREIVIDNGSEKLEVSISGSRTKVKIGGKDDKRKNLKVGMNCSVTYATDGHEATLVDCQN